MWQCRVIIYSSEHVGKLHKHVAGWMNFCCGFAAGSAPARVPGSMWLRRRTTATANKEKKRSRPLLIMYCRLFSKIYMGYMTYIIAYVLQRLAPIRPSSGPGRCVRVRFTRAPGDTKNKRREGRQQAVPIYKFLAQLSSRVHTECFFFLFFWLIFSFFWQFCFFLIIEQVCASSSKPRHTHTHTHTERERDSHTWIQHTKRIQRTVSLTHSNTYVLSVLPLWKGSGIRRQLISNVTPCIPSSTSPPSTPPYSKHPSQIVPFIPPRHRDWPLSIPSKHTRSTPMIHILKIRDHHVKCQIARKMCAQRVLPKPL